VGAGFEAEVFESADGWILRVARDAEAGGRLERESRLLPRLRPRVPVEIPQPRAFRRGPGALGHGVLVYRKLAGTPLSPDAVGAEDRAHSVAADLAGFLRALHRFPLEEAHALDLPGGAEARRRAWEHLRAVVLPALRTRLPRREFRTVRDWWNEFLADPEMDRFAPVLCHGDPWYGNVLLGAGGRHVAAVLDFAGAHVGDPAQDLAAQGYLGSGFVEDTISAYRARGARPGRNFEHRLARYWQLREFGGAGYAVRSGDPRELDDALRKLRAGPVLRPATGVDARGPLSLRPAPRGRRRSGPARGV
jgi:aminoglycoside phosphotransferase (APT) family kinase protein